MEWMSKRLLLQLLELLNTIYVSYLCFSLYACLCLYQYVCCNPGCLLIVLLILLLQIYLIVVSLIYFYYREKWCRPWWSTVFTARKTCNSTAKSNNGLLKVSYNIKADSVVKLIYATHQRSIDDVGKSLIDMDNSAYEASVSNVLIRSCIIPFTVYQFVAILCFHE